MAMMLGYSSMSGYSNEDSETLSLGALLHDTGKIWIPDDILKKPEKLNEKEYEIMKNHPLSGYKYLYLLEADPIVAQMSLGHHFHKRYPKNVFPTDETHAMETIDTFDAWTSDERPYIESMSMEKTLAMMENYVAANQLSRAHFESFAGALNSSVI
jgi:HD-GYP domain-containing protein (c-di-GMP phosphodiesterase class II)